ncbi:MAG: hypothetical protein EHM79_20235, partial [Geobacter sp.]
EKVTLDIPGNIAGFAKLQATYIDEEGNFKTDYQNIFIVPSDNLKIGIQGNRKSYLPGEKATFNFQCRTTKERAAALEVSLVEENVTPHESPRSMENSLCPENIQLPHAIPLSIRENVKESLNNCSNRLPDDSLQTRARIAFSLLKPETNHMLLLNFYDRKLQMNQERRNNYFLTLFLIFFRLLLLTGYLCFVMILAFTLGHVYLKGKDEKRILFIKDNEEIISLFIFLIGFFILLLVPLLFIVPVLLFSSIDMMKENRSLFQLLLTIELFLMFIYLVALWRNSRVRPIRKMPTMKYSFFTLQWYVGSIIVLSGILFTSSYTPWNLDLIITHDAPYLLITLLTLCAMPFLLLYNVLSHLLKPRKSTFRTLSFYASSVIIIAALITYSCLIFANRSHIQKDLLSRFLPGSHLIRKTPEKTKCECPVCIDNENRNREKNLNVQDILYYEPQLVTSESGNATLSLPLPDSSNPIHLEAYGLTKEGNAGFSQKAVNTYSELLMEVDAPVRLTAGDEVSIPVTLNNCSGNSRETTAFLSGSPGISLHNQKLIKMN